tara:strand:- start:709 stop:1392 length:684 start_codon:yes stop_codon:yes gene_type:complete
MSEAVAAPAPADGPDEGADDQEAEAAAERQMESVNKAFSTAKAAGVPAAVRLMKELRRVCVGGSFEVSLNDDAEQPLLSWAVRLFEWNFADDSELAEDLAELSARRNDDELTPLCLGLKFPNDFPFGAPLVYIQSPALLSGNILDAALCMEMLVEWQPQYGNIEAMLVQICAFLSANSRVASLAAEAAGQAPGPSAGPVAQADAEKAYSTLQNIHDKKGWGSVDARR